MNDWEKDQKFMSLVIKEAARGFGSTSPNPVVGALLVKNNEILGIGFHEKYGGNHAEVNAILNAKKNNQDIEGSTLYVNLEPCSHTNKQTPPCAPLIVKEKIKKVVISNIDPNPFVSGGGIQILKENNIEVVVGVLKTEGEILNEVFFKSMEKKSAFVHLKMAQTLDGKVATITGESKYISGSESLNYVHGLRQKYDGIIIGKNTLIKDNPTLTVRLPNVEVKHPLRIVFTNLKAIDFSLNVFSDEFKRNTMVITTDSDLKTNKEISFKLESLGIALLALQEDSEGRVDLKSFLKTMYSLKITSLLLEGGPALASSFLKQNLIDKVSIITAPYFLGEGMTTLNNIGVSLLEEKKELNNISHHLLGKDFLVEGYLCLQE